MVDTVWNYQIRKILGDQYPDSIVGISEKEFLRYVNLLKETLNRRDQLDDAITEVEKVLKALKNRRRSASASVGGAKRQLKNYCQNKKLTVNFILESK